MKIQGSEKVKTERVNFFVNVVDTLDSFFTVVVKKTFLGSDYKKRTFTNGKLEKTFTENAVNNTNVKFKVIDADWLVILDEEDNISLYVTSEYVGPIQTKNKSIQNVIDENYLKTRSRIQAKRDFAREMSSISKKLNLPFHLVMAFKGDEESLLKLMANIEEAIKNRMYENKNIMHYLNSNANERQRALQNFGVVVPYHQTEKVCKYISDCLEKRRIVRRFE